MTRDQLTLKKFEAALAETPSASPVELLEQVLAATKSAPAGASGATAQRILDELRSRGDQGATARELSEAVGCSVGRVYEVARAEGSPITIVKGEGRQAARLVIPQEQPARRRSRRSTPADDTQVAV